jgi:cytidylate kinase
MKKAVAKMVEKQMRNWEINRAQHMSVFDPDQQEVGNFIAISRSLGSGGKAIASMLGEKLGWPVFGKEILEVMAGDDQLRRRVYDSMDERDMGWLEETLRAMMQPEFVKNDYFHRLTETILSLARQSHAVFLGRGAHLILPRRMGLRVGIVAPRDMCVETYARRANLTTDQARTTVEKLERERAEFIQHHFRVDVADPAQHDMIVNRERFTLNQTVELILSARKIAARG